MKKHTIKPFTAPVTTTFKPVIKTKQPEVKAAPAVPAGPKEKVDVDLSAAPPKQEVQAKVITPEPKVERKAPAEEVPTVLTQDAVTPAQAVSEPGPVTETQLVTQALDSYGKADNHFSNLNATFEVMSPDQQKEIGKATFYSVASMTGEMKTDEGRPMTSGEIREEVAGWKDSGQTDRVKNFEGKVGQFMQEHPEKVMLGQAIGAAEWGGARWDELQSKEEGGQAVDPMQKEIAASAYLNGMGYAEETNKFAGAMNELEARGHGQTAQAVADATINA